MLPYEFEFVHKHTLQYQRNQILRSPLPLLPLLPTPASSPTPVASPTSAQLTDLTGPAASRYNCSAAAPT